MTTASYREFTESAAQLYERFFVPAIATPAATELLARAALRSGDTVLDVACGTGLVARLAAARVGATGSVTGLDLSPDMIEVASGRPSTGAPIEWRTADAVSLPLADQSFDVALCQMGLMFVEDKTAAVEEMFRVLRPGGRVVINTPGRMQPPFSLMERAIVDHINPELGGFVRAVFSMPDPAVLGALLAAAGFAEVETGDYIAELDLPAPVEFLWHYINLTPMASVIAAAPESAKAAMEAQLVDGWRAWTADGPVALDQPMALASARRP